MAPEDIAADPVGLLADEFMERCRRGERPSVSEYTERHPQLADRIRQVFSMIMVMEQAGSQDGGASTGESLSAAEKQEISERIGGYRILREIGQGGMGVVYEAEQTALGRHVALKVLPIGAARKRDRWERFQREARAAARLHHTNIVPVYEVGADGDLCYYAMQFIQGQPLDVVLQELRSLYQDSRSPAVTPQPNEPLADRQAVARSLFAGQTVTQPESPDGAAADRDFIVQSSPPPAGGQSSSFNLAGSTIAPAGRSGRWHYYRNVASVGIQAAEALEYAHREGVIHRDIKPSNLLLDAAGRIWITDFGLALQTEALAPGAKGLTQTGEIVGTIRYMPPERFRGWSDPRSDVYSLGLTLYEMLLFRPAFDAPDQVGLMHLVTETEPVRPRTADAQIPRDLETIILKAIDKEPARRYQSAAELAGDLKRFIEDRPILARHTGITERIWRWSRRHPSKVALAASVVGILVLVAAGWAWQAQQRELRTERVSQALDWAVQLRDQGRWGEAHAAAEHLSSGADGDVELRRRVEEFLDELRFVERLFDIRGTKGEHVDGSTDAKYALAFREHGIDVESLTAEEAGARIRSRPDAVARELVAALDDWAVELRLQKSDLRGLQRLIAVAQVADTDSWRSRLRALLDLRSLRDRESLTVVQELKAEADVVTWPVQSLQLMGQVMAATGDYEAAVSWLRDAQRRHPGDVWINWHLARNLEQLRPPRLDEAIAFFRAAVAVRPELAHALAHALQEQGNLDEAIDLFQELVRRNPNDVRHHYCLGRALKEHGKLTAALTALDRALVLRPEDALIYNQRGCVLSAQRDFNGALADFDRAINLHNDFAEAHYNRGLTLAKLRRWDEALPAYDRAIELRTDYFLAHHSRGVALAAKGQMKEAVAAYDRGLALQPGNAETHYNRANALRNLRRLDDALKGYDDALALKPDYAVAHTNRGNVLRELNRLDEALAAYDTALRFQPDLAAAHLCRGDVLLAKGQLSDAQAAYDRALVHNPNLADAHFNRGRILREKGQLSEAQLAFTQAIGSKPGYAEAHCNLGAVLMMQGQFAEARVAYRKGHELGSKDPRWSYPSAQWVRTIEQLIEAEKKLSELRRGDYQPANATERLRFAQCFAYKGIHGAAARQFEEAFKAQPELAENVSMGHRSRAACSAALAGCGKGKDAAELDELVRAYWRGRALTWLRDDLRAWSKRLQEDKSQPAQVRRILWIWRQDNQLAGIRDAAEIAKLPAAEQESFKQFWAEVTDLLQRAHGRK